MKSKEGTHNKGQTSSVEEVDGVSRQVGLNDEERIALGSAIHQVKEDPNLPKTWMDKDTGDLTRAALVRIAKQFKRGERETFY